MSNESSIDPAYVRRVVEVCLNEDVDSGDLTAEFTPNATIHARLISRRPAVICGAAFFSAVFEQLDPRIASRWRIGDGGKVESGEAICDLHGPARPILTGERSAVNLLQTLSGTATAARRYVDAVAGTGARILDTRKTIPGLRAAQKWAVRCGGGYNHRQGLFDGILIKENHLRSGESIADAVARAKNAAPPGVPLTIEVENLDQLKQALDAGAPRVLLDNYSIESLKQAVSINRQRAELEASGGITLDNVRAIAETGVDTISVGAITKDLEAVDLSLRFDPD
ncbi:MAG: Nicotinate-nucleotide pyrophosphorylase [carboxylating] [Gammaproteobacteria bacterium]|nr:Nicotinate-nucleotide pyrophosphorylase [carboxylating] [Gammaproteobacteria bacterium]